MKPDSWNVENPKTSSPPQATLFSDATKTSGTGWKPVLLRRWPSCAQCDQAVFGADVYCIDEWFEDWMMGPEAAARSVREFVEPFAGVLLPPAIERELK